ncbi:hypothetical protein [unidentified bacterial endosymbiont]|uniref:hypothetical protein n=1 Tax=unidentified bacterial endosymbiont TaxID=2355 RepID=UPI00209E2689|nr:hypothetical protein [unidentified bacterial endosymbiont]
MNISDVYEYVEKRNLKDMKFKNNVARLYKNNAKWVIPFYDLISSTIFFWLKPREEKKYLFLGSRFTHLIAALPKNEVCIIGGPRQLFYCIKNNISYIPNGNFWKLLSLGFEQNIRSELLKECSTMSSNLTKMVKKRTPALIILENDSLPLQRAFCNIAIESGIKTVCIQHGLFQSKTDPETIDGWKCDYFICYDANQRNVISGLGVSSEKILIGGFYQPIERNSNISNPGQLKICFLGQPWFKYGDEYKNIYLNILERTASQLSKYEIKFNFKPHPWEMDALYLSDMENVFRGDMTEAISQHDVFLSLTSTALLEVTMAGKVAIQIYDQQFACDNFEKLGYAYTIRSENIESSLLETAHNSPFTFEMPDFNNLVYQLEKLAKVNV